MMINHVADQGAVRHLQTLLARLPITLIVLPEDVHLVVSQTRGVLTLQHLKQKCNQSKYYDDYSTIPTDALVNLILDGNSPVDARINLCQRYLASTKAQHAENLELIKHWTVRKPLGVYMEYARQILKVDDVQIIMAALTMEKIGRLSDVVLALLSMNSVLV
jgi:hypothetical protein